MQEQDKKELISSMRRKRLKKYALTALALLIVVSVAVGFKLEDRNAKLPDGQGEIVVNTDQTGENLDAQDGSGDATQRDRTAAKRRAAIRTSPQTRARAKQVQARRKPNRQKNIRKRRRRSWMPRISKWTTRTISLPPMTATAH